MHVIGLSMNGCLAEGESVSKGLVSKSINSVRSSMCRKFRPSQIQQRFRVPLLYGGSVYVERK